VTRVRQAKYKISRSVGTSIWGDQKDPINTKNYRPGQHGAGGNRGPLSDYGLHLRAKQTLKAHYGRVTEKQFRNLFKMAAKMKGNTAENLAGLLERRLDMVVYRMNLAPSIFAARQMVSHGHVRLNGKKVNIPSQRLSVGDKIELKDGSKQILFFSECVKAQTRSVPDYLSVDSDKMTGEFVRVPMISDIPYPFIPQFGKVVEYYSH
jgi:small subunit ribosomal protein S4